jgi:hypothetical protein
MLKDLTETDAALVKGMLQRGDRQSDIAAWFKTNSGRISETNTGRRFRNVEPAPPQALPPAGPYKILVEPDLARTREVAVGERQLQDVQETLALLLRKTTAIEREVGLVERPYAPRLTRHKPLG